MNYIKVKWCDAEEGVPVIWYSEIGADRYEIRKIGIFRDGSYGYADNSNELGGMWLSDQPVPSIEDIKSQGFEVVEITLDEFEEAWLLAKKTHEGTGK